MLKKCSVQGKRDKAHGHIPPMWYGNSGLRNTILSQAHSKAYACGSQVKDQGTVHSQACGMARACNPSIQEAEAGILSQV